MYLISQLIFLTLLLPGLIKSQGWKIDQPLKYIILNGEYIELPVEERDNENPSILSSLNPMNTFQNFWSSLPSLNFLRGQDEEKSEPIGSTGIELKAQGSSPSGLSVPFPSFMSNPTSFSGIGNFFSGMNPFMKKRNGIESFSLPMTSHLHSHLVKRSLLDPIKYRKDEPKGSVRYSYKPLGQGSFYRYEIPIPTSQELFAEQQVQKEEKVKVMSPMTYGFKPFSQIYNPMVKPQYTKPYYNEGLVLGSSDKPIPDLSHTKDSSTSQESSSEDETEDPFPCPKIGFWKYDGTLCTAPHAIPPWSCKPIDLVKSGKLVICRNKVHY